jgi:hypothetical protein
MQEPHIAADLIDRYLETVGGGFTAVSKLPNMGQVVWGVWLGSDDCHMRQCILEKSGWLIVRGLFTDGQYDVEPVTEPLFWR